MTKSSMLAPSKAMRPCTASSNAVAPARHLEPQRAAVRPAPPAAARSSSDEAQARAVVLPRLALGLRRARAPPAGARRCSSSSRPCPSARSRSAAVAVPVQPLRLEVRRVRAAHLGPLVPVQPQPAQPVQDAGDHVGRRALDVGVFDAQHEHAAVAAGVEPVEERRAGAADVQVARGRRRKTDARGHA